MAKPKVAIVGLGLIGGSIGMGLKSSSKDIYVVGHDIDHGIGRLAKKMGAVDDSALNLINACDDADLVIIATPLAALRETLGYIGPHLKPGCVVTDTTTIKVPVLRWAAETLPAGVAFVGGDPLLKPDATPDHLAVRAGLESARADLFHGALYVLCPSAETPPTAVKRVTDMANLLKAHAFFVDPVEHDGMRAMVDGLSVMTSLALMRLVSGSPSWLEARKLADFVFGTATAPLAGNIESNRAQVLDNADHLLPRLDAYIQELAGLRKWIAEHDTEALTAAFDQATADRATWLRDWMEGNWVKEEDHPEIKGTMGSLGDMLGFGLGKRKSKEE
jgi:prephenate dehydrogenase